MGLNNSPLSFSPTEIDEALIALNAAIEQHQQWFRRFHEALLCSETFEETVTSELAHTICNFGRWFYESATQAVRCSQEFSLIEKEHEQLHNIARLIATNFKLTNSVTLESYREIAGTQKKLQELLVSMRDDILGQQHSFDPLTGLLNRKSIALLLDKNHANSIRHDQSYVIAMLDIDFFKSVNDTYGHMAGDTVLKQVSNFLFNSIRDSDTVGRYGGEEFIALLPKCTNSLANKVLDRLRQGISDLIIDFEQLSIKCTISIGFSEHSGDKPVSTIIKEADEALYRAKSDGRNRVSCYSNLN